MLIFVVSAGAGMAEVNETTATGNARLVREMIFKPNPKVAPFHPVWRFRRLCDESNATIWKVWKPEPLVDVFKACCCWLERVCRCSGQVFSH